MIFLQVQGDSALQAAQTAVSAATEASQYGAWVMLSALTMPLLALAIFSSAKALICVGIDKIDVYDFFAEMAIDFLSIFSSFIIGRFILETNSSGVLISSFKIIGLMVLFVLVLCFIRRKVAHCRQTNDVSMNTVKWMIAGEYGIDFICFFLMMFCF